MLASGVTCVLTCNISCAVSSHQEIVERKRQKVAKATAAATAAADTTEKFAPEHGDENVSVKMTITLPLREVETRIPIEPQKRGRTDDVVVKTYVPQWGVLENDAIIASAPAPTRDVGLDLCRGLVLPTDQPMYDKVDDMGACNKMLALLSMVSLLLSCYHIFSSDI